MKVGGATPNDTGFAGRTALVTGAASGIGRTVALKLAEHGCNVGLIDLDPDGLAETAGQVTSKGVRAGFATSDVSSQIAVKEAVRQLIDDLNGFDFLVNSAGDAHIASILDVTDAQFEKTMRVNVWGVFNCTRAVLPTMISKGGGSIVNVSSWLGKSGRPKMSAYCTSKFAVIGLSECMAHDLAEHGIRVNTVCPGAVNNTRMREAADKESMALGLPTAHDRADTIPLKRLGEPEDIANAVLFLLDPRSGYITGESVNVTGGLWMR